MKYFVIPLAAALLIELVVVGIDRAMKPYTELLWAVGIYGSLSFISFLWGKALDERLHRLEQRNLAFKRISR